MAKRLVSHDPLTGAATYMHDDGSDVIIQNTQDVSKLLEANKAEYNQIDEKARWGEWSRVASIDLTTWLDLKKKGIMDDPARLKSWLNNPENRYYRTRPGVV